MSRLDIKDVNPTPTRFLKECGAEIFTPRLADELNVFENSFEAQVRKENTNTKGGLVAADSKLVNVNLSPNADMTTTQTMIIDISNQQETAENTCESTMQPCPSSDSEVSKRMQNLERNRLAAFKCRQKKKMQLKEMESRIEELYKTNRLLKERVKVLEKEVIRKRKANN
ncbi:hypothetical protein O9G_003116 [Rozella allomycis CSF55]|uniref:BZIP domain-containing protein n=1 Tax=Rozella allomycis (strain CSF55) TaxID=988480 RepID=A0A075ASK0_ROZAC|nr:hypothetical protein O9G_003116 [Rozella allomycis CSF55]|eukprot:EPZ33120.1 hypothetical protein O9G_003116 [Rozella allomycis CSF55]